MKRCENCFENNSDGATNCVICGEPLAVPQLNDEIPQFRCSDPKFEEIYYYLWALHLMYYIDVQKGWEMENHTQTAVSDDGRVRFVLAHRDPGVPNWLDTTGRTTGLCTLRWFWPTDDERPAMDVRLVDVSDVLGALPDQTPSISPDERAAELADRQAHLRWRFRT